MYKQNIANCSAHKKKTRKSALKQKLEIFQLLQF